MSAAGREMGLSPAVVSKRISQLEEHLGARLFQRTTRQLTLTETGAGYFKRVVDILSLCEEAEDFVSRRNTKPRGVLKITMPTTFSRLHIAPYLGKFLASYPDIELDSHLTDRFVDIIREGFDLAIRIGELEDSSLVARKIATDNRVICAAPAYLEKYGTPASLADLNLHNCLSAGAQDVWRLEGPDGEEQVRTNGNLRSNSGELIREAVLAGLGLGLRSTWDVGTELKSGKLKVVLPPYRGSSTSRSMRSTPAASSCPRRSTSSSSTWPSSMDQNPIGTKAWTSASSRLRAPRPRPPGGRASARGRLRRPADACAKATSASHDPVLP